MSNCLTDAPPRPWVPYGHLWPPMVTCLSSLADLCRPLSWLYSSGSIVVSWLEFVLWLFDCPSSFPSLPSLLQNKWNQFNCALLRSNQIEIGSDLGLDWIGLDGYEYDWIPTWPPSLYPPPLSGCSLHYLCSGQDPVISISIKYIIWSCMCVRPFCWVCWQEVEGGRRWSWRISQNSPQA